VAVIAQVVKGVMPAGPLSDEMRKYVVETLAQARQADGCEGLITLSEPSRGETLSINLFRDQAALDAFDALREKLTAEAETTTGGRLAAPEVYSEVFQA
jgi:hypothetical protein